MRAMVALAAALTLTACGGGGGRRPPQPPRPPVEARPYFAWFGADAGQERRQYAIDAANQVAACVGVDPRQVFRDHVVYVFDSPFACGQVQACGCSTYLTQIQIVVGEPCDYRVGMATELLHQILWFNRENTDYDSPRWRRVDEGGCRWW